MGGQEGKRRGRRDVPPKDYFPQDENMLKMIKNYSDLQKKCEMCNILFSSRIEMKNHVQMKHEQEFKKAFSKEAMSLVPFHRNYMSWLQRDHIVKILASRRKELNKVDKKRSNENEDGTYFIRHILSFSCVSWSCACPFPSPRFLQNHNHRIGLLA